MIVGGTTVENECPFCAWMQGKTKMPPVVFEDDHLIATLCESPIAQGHTQIAFKKHYDELSKVDPQDSARMGKLIPLLSAAIKNGMNAEMIYVACISEEVRHVHFHLVPRFTDQKKGFTHFLLDRQQIENADEVVQHIKHNLVVQA